MANGLKCQFAGTGPAPSDNHLPGGAAWIETPFQVTVRGKSQSGERFTLNTVLDGLSPSFLALRLPWQLELEQTLFSFIGLVVPPQRGLTRSGVAAKGVVVCTDERPGGVWRVTLELVRRRFIYARSL